MTRRGKNIVQAKPAITVFFLKNIRHLASPFPTQLFNKFNNEKRGRFFTKIVKICPRTLGARFISRP